MFEIGFSELLVIFVLALVVLGPERLPRLAQQVGRWIGRARAMAKQFREQLEDEVNLADMKKWQESSSQSTSNSSSTSTNSSTSSTTQSDSAASAHTDASGHADSAHTTAASNSTESSGSSSHAPESAATTSGSTPPGHQGPGHYAGPPPEPEPEASVYQPPAYGSAGGTSSANGATPHPTSNEPAHAVESAAAATHSNSTASHDPAPASDERPARPGDVITHTHERGI